jgi:RimJ/RimL family protein N-acetyltransferase
VKVTVSVLDAETVRRLDTGVRAPDWHPGYPAATDVSLVRLAAERLTWSGGGELGIHAIRAGGIVVGTVALTPLGPDGWELSYHVVEPVRRQGIATEVVRQVTATWGPLRAETEPANIASQKILRRNGFRQAADGSGRHPTRVIRVLLRAYGPEEVHGSRGGQEAAAFSATRKRSLVVRPFAMTSRSSSSIASSVCRRLASSMTGFITSAGLSSRSARTPSGM